MFIFKNPTKLTRKTQQLQLPYLKHRFEAAPQKPKEQTFTYKSTQLCAFESKVRSKEKKLMGVFD